MLNRYEIDLLQNAKKILREAEEWRASIGEKSSMFWLYNALVKLSNSAPSCYKISEILKEKPEDVLMWCMSVMGDKLELPAPLDENNILMVTMNGWMGRGVDNILDINLNGLKYLHLEYDHEDKTLHQYTYNDPHNEDFTNEQIIDVSPFKETSSLSIIAELEEKYGIDIRISPVPEQESFVYGIVVGSDSSKCSTITTKDYPSADALLEALENEILPEYQKMADSFVKLNSLVKGAKIL